MNDRNAHLFSLLTNVSDELVEESLILPEERISKPKQTMRWFSDLMSSPVAAAVLSGVVALAVLVAIVTAGQKDPTIPVGSSNDSTQEQPDSEDFKPFYVGMPCDDMMEALEDTFYFQYGTDLFVPRTEERFLVIRTDLNEITKLALCDEKTPTHEDFAKVETGMDIFRVSALLGRPEGSYTSGTDSMAYRTADGALYYVYFHGEGRTVSRVSWINSQAVSMTVTSPTLPGDHVTLCTDPDILAKFDHYFSHVYTSLVYESLPSDPDPETASVIISYEDGTTREYRLRGSLLSRDGGKTWEKIQDHQPIVTVTWQEMISWLTMEPREANVYILWTSEEGFWGYFADLNAEVYVKMDHDFQLYDTVTIRYFPDQLQKSEGVLPIESFYYSMILENPLSVKPSSQQMRG